MSRVNDWSGEQLEVLHHRGNPMLVLGGPGTGKTEVLIEQVARRVADDTRLDHMVILSHSRTAAQRLRMRIVRRLGGAHLAPRVTTVHGLSLGLIRQFADPQTWGELRLLQAPEQEFRLRELLAGHDTSGWPPEYAAAAPTAAFAGQLRSVLARARQMGLDPTDLEALSHIDPVWGVVGDFFEEYLTVLDFEQTLDYAELVHRARLLLTDEANRVAFGANLKAVFVDEFAELDPAQLRLIADLAKLGCDLTVFADPQQSIFGFRAAQERTVSWFHQNLGHTRTVTLTRNFRAGPDLIRAWSVIADRLDATDAPPTSLPASRMAAVRAVIYDSRADEISHVAQQLRQAHLRDGVNWSHCAVITRTSQGELTAIARGLRTAGIPVELVGDEVALAEHLAVRPLLLALSCLLTERLDREQAVRLLTSPLVGLDALRLRTLGRRLRALARSAGQAPPPSSEMLAEVLNDPCLAEEDAELTPVVSFGRLLAECRRGLAAEESVHQLLWRLWTGTSWPDRLRSAALNGDIRAGADLDALCELFDQAGRFTGLVAERGVRVFLAEIAGRSIPADTTRESDLRGRGVQVLTAHRAKGEQFRRVFLVGLQEGHWPQLHRRGKLLDADSLEAAISGTSQVVGQIGYERRLFYLACSRASEQLVVSASSPGNEEGERPSRFLDELGVEVERVKGPSPAPLTLAGMVKDLRQVACDPAREPGLRRAAAARLARLSELQDRSGRSLAPGADPRRWWGVRGLTGEPIRSNDVRLASTDIADLIECPRRWFLQRRIRAEQASASASVGQVVHLLAQHANLDGLSSADLTAHLDRIWDRIVFEAQWLSAAERADAEDALRRLLAWQETDHGRRLLGVEVEFCTEVEVGDQHVTIHGTVDRLELDEEGRLRVIDFKTSRQLPTAAEVAEHDQLGVYQLAAKQGAFDTLAPGVREVGAAELIYLRGQDGSHPWPKIYRQASLDLKTHHQQTPPEAPSWVHDRIAQAAEIAHSGDYPAKKCDSCRFCAFWRGCPAVALTPEVVE